MSTNIFTGDFGELVVETQMIDVTSSLPKPDTRWTYTDQQGHEHRYDDGYPTLRRVVDRTYWCEECRDEHEDAHLECRECGEHVTPGSTYSMHREYVPGRTAAYLNGEPISKERYEEIVAQFRAEG